MVRMGILIVAALVAQPLYAADYELLYVHSASSTVFRTLYIDRKNNKVRMCVVDIHRGAVKTSQCDVIADYNAAIPIDDNTITLQPNAGNDQPYEGFWQLNTATGVVQFCDYRTLKTCLKVRMID